MSASVDCHSGKGIWALLLGFMFESPCSQCNFISYKFLADRWDLHVRVH
jgi:hypothetical protein